MKYLRLVAATAVLCTVLISAPLAQARVVAQRTTFGPLGRQHTTTLRRGPLGRRTLITRTNRMPMVIRRQPYLGRNPVIVR